MYDALSAKISAVSDRLKQTARLGYRAVRLVFHLGAALILVRWLHAVHGAAWHKTASSDRIVLWWFRRLTRILGVRVFAHGAPSPGPVMLAANHVSWLDAVAIYSICPAAFLAKASVRSWPILGSLAAAAGTIFVQRGRLSAVAEAMSSILDRLRCGQRVVIFPEGTTTEGTSVLAFHSALFQAAIGAKCAVQAVALRYMRDGRPDPEAAFVDDDAFIPHLLKVLSTRTTEIHLHWCEALAAGHHSRRRLALHTRSQILAILEHKFWRGAA